MKKPLLIWAFLALFSMVRGPQTAFCADWTSDERMVASVTAPKHSWALRDLCEELGKQTSSEFFVDRREGDRKIAWFAGQMKLKSAMNAVQTVTGLKWRMVGDMFFLCRDPEGAAVTRWNQRYAEAKKAHQAGIARKQVKDWVKGSMPFPARYDPPWMLTPLQREQVAFQQSLLFFTMTPPQLSWLDASLTRLGYEASGNQTVIDEAAAVSPDTPVKFNAAMIIRGQGRTFLVEMPLSAETAKEDETASPKPVRPGGPASDSQDNVKTEPKRLALKDTLKALWVTADSLDGLARLTRKAKPKGFNALFLPVLRSGYTIYASKLLPRDRQFKDVDALSSAIKVAAESGMKVHAVIDSTLWGDAVHVAPPAANYVALWDRNLLGRTFADQDKWQQAELKAMEQEALPGETPSPEEKRLYLCPGSSRLPRLLAAMVEEIALNYDVAGVCLDNVDYAKGTPFMVGGEDLAPPYGYTLEIRREMIRLNQVDPVDVDPASVRNQDDAEAFALWDRFRRGHLTGLLNEVATVYKAKKSDGIFSATLDLTSDAQSPVHWSSIAGLDAIMPLEQIRGAGDDQKFTFSKDDSDALLGLHRAVLKNAAVVPTVVGLKVDSAADQMSALSDVLKTVKDSNMKGYILRGDMDTLSAAMDLMAD